MIVFDLRCPDGHVFEGWFGTGADFDAQAERGLITCPVCGADDVVKAAMAPAVPGKANQQADFSPAQAKVLLGKLASAQRKALENSDYVGDRFASEARAIHLGESEARAIHGQATAGDAKALIEEGVKVAPLPLPFVPPGQEN